MPARPGCAASPRPPASSRSACSRPPPTARWPARRPISWPASSRSPTPTATATSSDHARVAVAAVAAPFAGFDDAPEARAIAALGTIGTVVVAPAGNDGPTGARYGSLSSPGGAPDALTVGASDGRPALPQISIQFAGAVAEHVAAAAMAGALAPQAGQTLPVKAITGAARTTRTAGAQASDYQGPDGATLVAGAAVLVPRDGGDLRAKARQAAAQGAAAVLVYGTAELPAGALGGDDRVGIPVLGIDGALGLRLAQAVAAGQPVTVTAGAATYAPNALRDAVAPFSSEGLGWDDRLKPDVVLPGVAIIGAEAGGGYAAVSGTSVAAAQAAGLVAVLAAQHPDWSAARLRSALVSTGALVRGLDAPLAPVQAQGGGRPNAATASAVTVATNPSTLSLGRPGADGVAHGTLTVENLTDAARTLSLGLQRDAAGDAAGLTAAIDPARFVLAPHAVATLPVAVRLASPAGAVGVAGGWVVVTPDAGPAQHVPLAVALPGPDVVPIRTATLAPAAIQADGKAEPDARSRCRRGAGRRHRPAGGRPQPVDRAVPRQEAAGGAVHVARPAAGPLHLRHPPGGRGRHAAHGRQLPRRRAGHRHRRRRGPHVAAAARAMTSVALYWAEGCHLCEPAKVTTRTVCAELGVPLREIDITGDETLEATYRAALPVLEIDGRRAFKFFVDEHDLRERLGRTLAR